MKELSLHILDIVQNSINAKATDIDVSITENANNNLLSIIINDNGSGMSKEQMNNSLNPFYTTKNKKTGLGIPLFKQHAEMANGKLEIQSELGKGTSLKAFFELHNIDRQPIGDITNTFIGLIRATPSINFNFSYSADKNMFNLNTKDIKSELDGIPINSPEVISFLKEMIAENLKEIRTN